MSCHIGRIWHYLAVFWQFSVFCRKGNGCGKIQQVREQGGELSDRKNVPVGSGGGNNKNGAL